MSTEFITDLDLARVMALSRLNKIPGGRQLRQIAAQAAVAEAKGWISPLEWDVPAAFAVPAPWSPSTTYAVGDLCSLEIPAWQAGAYATGDQVVAEVDDLPIVCRATRATTSLESPASTPAAWERLEAHLGMWRALRPSTGAAPSSGSLDWEQHDPRPEALVVAVADLAIYVLLARTESSAVPEARQLRRDAAIAWLKAVASGTIPDPGLPRLASPETPLGSAYVSSRAPGDFTL